MTGVGHCWQAGLFPCAEELADEDELADVVGVVVGGEQGLSQEGLAVAVGDFGVEVVGLIGDEGDEGLEVIAEGADGLVPGLVVRRGGLGRPVACGPLGRLVVGVAGKFENVGLGDAEMLEEFPGRVVGAFGALAAEGDGQIFDGGFEVGVGVAAGEETDDVFAEGSVFGHGARFRWRAGSLGVIRDGRGRMQERARG